MTGLLLLIVLLVALAVGLETNYRTVRRAGPPRFDAEVARELRSLGV